MIRTPTYNPEQAAAALEKANRLRIERAGLKRWIALLEPDLAKAEVAAVIIDPPAYTYGMKAYELVRAVKRMGPGKTSRIFRRLQVSELKTLGGLTERQRVVLAAELGHVRARQVVDGEVPAFSKPGAALKVMGTDDIS